MLIKMIFLLNIIFFLSSCAKKDNINQGQIEHKDVGETEEVNIYASNNYSQLDKEEYELILKIKEHIKNKNFSGLDFAINKNRKIRWLSIHHIPIARIISFISKFEDLNRLTLITNSMYEIPGLSSLNRLEVLVLESENLPEYLKIPHYLHNLRILSVQSHRIKEVIFPDGLKLIQLNLSSNNLQKLNSSISKLDSLKYLYLNNNQLTSLDLSGLENLEEVNIENNPIIDVNRIRNRYKNIKIIF